MFIQPIYEKINKEVIKPKNIAKPPTLTIFLECVFLLFGISIILNLIPNLLTGFTKKEVIKNVVNNMIIIFELVLNT